MKCEFVFFCILLSASLVSGRSAKPKDGFVPDKSTAVKIAGAVLVPVYGKEVIESEKPVVCGTQT